MLFIDITDKNDRDIYNPANYLDLKEGYRMQPSNSGNKLWLDAIEQYICQDRVKYSYYSREMKAEEINERYEYILAPMANLLNVHEEERMVELTSIFKNITIPIYMIGLGAQAKNEKDIKHLINKSGLIISRFMDSVLSTGGEVALRGYVTKEILQRMEFDQPKVIGCPSMFVNGPDFRIEKKNLEAKDIIPIVNGDTPFLDSDFVKNIFNSYRNAVYIDQETFIELLYGNSKKIAFSYYDLFKLVQRYSNEGIKLISEERIRLFFDIPVWKEYLRTNNFNFSIGTRIHGSIISILCGIPAVIVHKDLRVKEMADYLSIPTFDMKFIQHKKLEELYDIMDYEQFNKNYNEKYVNFKNFFDSNGIENTIGDNTQYLKKINQISYVYPPNNSNVAQEIGKLYNNQNLFAKLSRLLGIGVFDLKHLDL